LLVSSLAWGKDRSELNPRRETSLQWNKEKRLLKRNYSSVEEGRHDCLARLPTPSGSCVDDCSPLSLSSTTLRHRYSFDPSQTNDQTRQVALSFSMLPAFRYIRCAPPNSTSNIESYQPSSTWTLSRSATWCVQLVAEPWRSDPRPRRPDVRGGCGSILDASFSTPMITITSVAPPSPRMRIPTPVTQLEITTFTSRNRCRVPQPGSFFGCSIADRRLPPAGLGAV
jgi:hypothetical protein